MPLSRRFRRQPLDERRAAAASTIEGREQSFGSDPDMIDLADAMIESAIGYVAVPLGVATGFRIDGAEVAIPMATEEPSVVAAASFAGGLIALGGGFITTPPRTITKGQIFLRNSRPGAIEALRDQQRRVEAAAAPVLERMEARGGGIVGYTVSTIDDPSLVKIELHVDVRDAMGANIVNTALERIRTVVEEISGGECLMAILSNDAPERVTTARFSLPVRFLERAGRSGAEMAERCELASMVAEADSSRAVTHNKGIMNGITALALATGNDTRAMEAAAHAFASRNGRYEPLSTFRSANGALEGALETPVVLGAVGGAADIHPTSRAARALVGNPDAATLARFAAALGLSQNLAAVLALVGEGIQRGHMGLHARRIAWQAGARGEERTQLVEALREAGTYTHSAAEEALARIRSGETET